MQEDIEIIQHIDEYYSAYPHFASPNVPQPHHNLLAYIHLHSNSDHVETQMQHSYWKKIWKILIGIICQ
jgi:hypothetical protein